MLFRYATARQEASARRERRPCKAQVERETGRGVANESANEHVLPVMPEVLQAREGDMQSEQPR